MIVLFFLMDMVSKEIHQVPVQSRPFDSCDKMISFIRVKPVSPSIKSAS